MQLSSEDHTIMYLSLSGEKKNPEQLCTRCLEANLVPIWVFILHTFFMAYYKRTIYNLYQKIT